ncbi:MAG: DUF1786 domain-containing protein, partial [Syntrophales bacterium]|nr:DUF1786 domain-containing protein [Syntrophales bacterium]
MKSPLKNPSFNLAPGTLPLEPQKILFDGTLLALDMGGGTQDLFLWDPGQPMENAVKMVLPAPTQVLARRLQKLTAQGLAVFLGGRLMGGGALTAAVRRHLARGLPLYASPQAALTLSDRLEEVQLWGVTLTKTAPPDTATLTLGDVDLDSLRQVFAAYEVPFPSHFAVAVQDHGFSPQASNRRSRFEYWEDFLSRGGLLAGLAFREPPPRFTRMLAVQDALPGALLMDTCAAGVRGALLDSRARERQPEGLLVVNLGNAHTFAALARGERLWGIYEHHTGLLTPAKLFDHLRRFQTGELTNDEVFADNG